MEKRKKKVLFYYLSAFSHTGGIEKFNRCFIKALSEIDGKETASSIVSVYDANNDERYNDKLRFVGFKENRAASVLHIIREAANYDILVLGHINLAVAGVCVKLLRPRCKLVVIAHGIEVWDKLWFFKKWVLKQSDTILAVSNYTKNQLVLKNRIAPEKIRLFPNTIDPYFAVPGEFHKPDDLLKRYGLERNQPVIFTLARLSSSEQYKGYDKVIGALPLILKVLPNAIYILAGKYDDVEKKRLDEFVKSHHLESNVILTGFIADEEVADHYMLADVFIMPSRKEGFGIVFLEALACGTVVVGGNQDGTVDALLNGSLGKLINPTNLEEIASAIIASIQRKDEHSQFYQDMVLNHYRFSAFQKRLKQYLYN